MTAIHAHRIEPLLGEWQLHETFDLMHLAPTVETDGHGGATIIVPAETEAGSAGRNHAEG
ncbi:MAG: hypothetical protein WA741_07605 [Candidatus Sulfotelmatobacter sp.]